MPKPERLPRPKPEHLNAHHISNGAHGLGRGPAVIEVGCESAAAGAREGPEEELLGDRLCQELLHAPGLGTEERLFDQELVDQWRKLQLLHLSIRPASGRRVGSKGLGCCKPYLRVWAAVKLLRVWAAVKLLDTSQPRTVYNKPPKMKLPNTRGFEGYLTYWHPGMSRLTYREATRVLGFRFRVFCFSGWHTVRGSQNFGSFKPTQI